MVNPSQKFAKCRNHFLRASLINNQFKFSIYNYSTASVLLVVLCMTLKVVRCSQGVSPLAVAGASCPGPGSGQIITIGLILGQAAPARPWHWPQASVTCTPGTSSQSPVTAEQRIDPWCPLPTVPASHPPWACWRLYCRLSLCQTSAPTVSV